MSGNDMTAVASAAPSRREHEPDAEDLIEPVHRSGPRVPNNEQQHVADDDRRQHERQMHERIEQRPPRKRHARQQPRDQRRERQAHDHAAQRDREAQAQGLHLERSDQRHAETFTRCG